MVILGLVGAFFLILLGLIVIHAKVNGGFKIETSWIAIGLFPAVIWLLATGQLQEFSGFGLAFKLREASAKPFSLKLDGSKIDPVPLTLGEKGGVGEIPELVRNRTGALTFELGRRGYYYGPAIRDYLERLTQHDFFRYVVFTDSRKEFRGLVPARVLLDQLRAGTTDIVRVIETAAIDQIRGVVAASVSTTSNKRDALKVMEEKNLAEVPVVDEAKRFVGIVERDKLTSSILLDLVAST